MRGESSSSSSKPGRKPAGSFIVILTEPDFDTTVMVPTHFSRKYEICLSRERVRLRVGGTEKTWFVKVEKKTAAGDENEVASYALTSGWKKFVADSGVRHGEFLIFNLAGSYQRGSTFDVSVYGPHGCQCLVPDGSKNFTVVLKKIHMPTMGIPMAMVDAETTGIKAGEWIKLQNGEGKIWAVEVCTRAREGQEQLFFNKGWGAFWEENNLCLGDVLRFSLVDTRPPTLLVVVLVTPPPPAATTAATATKKRKRRKRARKNV